MNKGEKMENKDINSVAIETIKEEIFNLLGLDPDESKIIGYEEAINDGKHCIVRTTTEDELDFYDEDIKDIVDYKLKDDRVLDEKLNFTMEMLDLVHTKWVKENQENFLESDKKYLYMPIELIGWEEVKNEFSQIKPILSAFGIEINEEKLENLEGMYNERLKNFIEDGNIKNNSDLEYIIIYDLAESQAQKKYRYKIYEEFKEQDKILGAVSNKEFVEKELVPQIEEKGIGKIEEVREKLILNKMIEKIKSPDDIRNGILSKESFDELTPEECEKLVKKMEEESDKLDMEYEELNKKDKTIEILIAKNREVVEKRDRNNALKKEQEEKAKAGFDNLYE